MLIVRNEIDKIIFSQLFCWSLKGPFIIVVVVADGDVI